MAAFATATCQIIFSDGQLSPDSWSQCSGSTRPSTDVTTTFHLRNLPDRDVKAGEEAVCCLVVVSDPWLQQQLSWKGRVAAVCSCTILLSE